MKISIRSYALATITLATMLTAVSVFTGRTRILDGPFFREPILGLIFWIGVLVSIPASFIATTSSLFYDQKRERRAAFRGAIFGILATSLLGGLVVFAVSRIL